VLTKKICDNKEVSFRYFLSDCTEAGIVLTGTEVKSIRKSPPVIKDSFIQIRNGEAFMHNMHIAPYDFGQRTNHDPLRVRKLLLNKKEISFLFQESREKSLTIVPTKMYFKNGKIKMEIGLGKGKKIHDKRETIKERDVKRDLEREMK